MAEITIDSWHSYPSIYALGHRYITDLLTVPVVVEEKIDGSQFSFMVDLNGDIHVRSKGAIIQIDAPEKMFNHACDTVKQIAPALHPGWTYRGEYLSKPKHNVLAYDRIPVHHIILFDISTGLEAYLSPEEKCAEAARIQLECVPVLYTGMVTSPDQLRDLLNTVSCLGGQKIEGVVVKPLTYNLFGIDKKVLMGKYVSEAFKEVHAQEWKKENPTTGDVITSIAESLRTPARWNKAVQHLSESGQLTHSPKDIGPLMKEVVADVHKECADDIKDKLFAYAWKQIGRQIIAGLPEWYRDKLLESQFTKET